MSLKMKLVKTIVKQFSKGMFNSEQIDVERLRGILKKQYEKNKIEKGVTSTLDTYRGVPVAVYKPDKITNKNIVYYVHGGGLITGDRQTAGPYSSQLALETGCIVVTCTYRLAPEDPFPAGVDDTFSVYQYLLEKHPSSNIALIGESGGAYLSLVTAIKARDEGIKLPSSVVLNSVVADMSGNITRKDSKKETTVSVKGLKQLGEMYAPGQALTNPYISPILADYTGLPPIRLIYDSGELLAIDSEKVAQKAKSAGVEAILAKYDGCFHGFATVGYGTPESKRELKASAQFMLKSFEK